MSASVVNISRLAAILMAVAAQQVAGGSDSQTVRHGNELYAQGKYDEALGRYTAATLDEPNEAIVLYNRAGCLYRLEKLEEAMELYRTAAAATRDTALTAKARYNLGNCYYQRAVMSQSDADLQKVLGDLTAAAAAYRSGLDLAPEDADARRNIAVVRLMMKDVLDKIKQQQQAEQMQQQRQELARKIAELLKRQLELLAGTDHLEQKDKAGEVAPKEKVDTCDTMSQQQQTLRQDTSAVRDDVRQMLEEHPAKAQGPVTTTDPNQINPAVQDLQVKQFVAHELGQATDHQGDAVQQLKGEQLDQAGQAQGAAAENLKRALEALGQPKDQQGQGDQEQQQDQQQQQDTQQQEQQGDQQQRQDSEKQPEQQQQQDQQQAGGDEQQAQAPDATAQAILDREDQRRQEKRRMQIIRQVPVDKDW